MNVECHRIRSIPALGSSTAIASARLPSGKHKTPSRFTPSAGKLIICSPDKTNPSASGVGVTLSLTAALIPQALCLQSEPWAFIFHKGMAVYPRTSIGPTMASKRPNRPTMQSYLKFLAWGDLLRQCRRPGRAEDTRRRLHLCTSFPRQSRSRRKRCQEMPTLSPAVNQADTR
jgi:hypothetical protein